MSPPSDEGSSTDAALSAGAVAKPGPRTAVVPAPEPGTDSTPKEARWQRDDAPLSNSTAIKQPAPPKSAPPKPPVSTKADAKSAVVTAPPKPTPVVKPPEAKPKADPEPKPVAKPTPEAKADPEPKPLAKPTPEVRADPAPEPPVVKPPVPTDDAPKTAAAPVAVVAPTATVPTVGPDQSDDDSMVVESRGRFGRREKFRARRVRRLVRHVDPWSVFKLTLVLNVCMWFIFLVAGITMWSVARSSGTIENFEKFIAQSFSLTDVSIDADLLFRVYSLIGLIITLALTGAAVIGSILFNLISDLIGGVWVSVIEEESAEPV